MATLDELFNATPYSNIYAGANPATPDYTGVLPKLNFNDTTDEFAQFLAKMPNKYGGGGLTFTILWNGVAIINNVIWNINISRIEDGVDSPGVPVYAGVQAVTDTVEGTTLIGNYVDITFTSGGQMDGWLKNEWAHILLSRDAGSDSFIGDAHFLALAMKET